MPRLRSSPSTHSKIAATQPVKPRRLSSKRLMLMKAYAGLLQSPPQHCRVAVLAEASSAQLAQHVSEAYW